MFKNITNFFSKKQKAIQNEIALKLKIDEVLVRFIEERIIPRKEDVKLNLSYTIKNGIIKLETDNKLLDQEIALRIRGLEEVLKNEGVSFKKILI